MIVSAIVAMDKNNLIGIGLKMPWRLPKDFKYFKDTTMGHPIIMGRKSFESIGCKPLKGRPFIIVSHNPELYYDDVMVDTVTTVEDAIALAESMDDIVYICGGGQIYKYALENKLVDELLITSVETYIDVEGKDFNDPELIRFPHFTHDNWDLVSVDMYEAVEKNIYGMNFLVFERNF